MREKQFTLPERQAAAKTLDGGHIPARTRRAAAKALSREKVSILHPLKMHRFRMHALRHLRNLDHIKHVQDGDPGFSLGESEQQPYEGFVPEALRRYLPHPDVTALHDVNDEKRLLELRTHFAKQAEKDFEKTPPEAYTKKKRRSLAVEIATNYIGLTPQERIMVLKKAEYGEKSMPIDMKKRLAIAGAWGIGLALAGFGIRLVSAAQDRIVPVLVHAVNLPTTWAVGLAIAASSGSFAIEGNSHARHTREFGTSGNPLISAGEIGSKRILTVPERRVITVGTATAIDLVFNNILFNGVIELGTNNPLKVITACLYATAFNLAIAGGLEAHIYAHRFKEFIKGSKKNKNN